MIRSFTEVLPHLRSNQPEVLVDRKIAATIPREDDPVKINPISASANDTPRTASAKPGNVPHPFFSFDAPDAPSRIGGELTLVVDRRDF
jgi:hypothetical protein